MPTYRFTARNEKNRKIVGEYKANSRAQLDEALARMGLKVTDAKLRAERASPQTISTTHLQKMFDAQENRAPFHIIDLLEDMFAALLPAPKRKYNPDDYKRTRAYLHSTIAKGSTDHMPTFCYVARNEGGGTITGEMEATDADDLAKRLKLLNLALLRITLAPTEEGLDSGRLVPLPAEELLIFCQQLEIYFTLDMTVPQMLDAIRQSCGSKPLKAVLWRIRHHMRQGDSFSRAVQRYPHVFGRFFMGVIEGGERAGELPLACRYAQKHLQWLVTARKEIIRKLRWPLFSGAFIRVMFMAMGWFSPLGLLPEIILLAAYLLVRGLRRFVPSVVDGALLQCGAPGRLWMQYDTASFVYLFSIMWRAGLPINDILTSAPQAMGNQALRDTMGDVAAKVKRGVLPSEAFREANTAPPMLLAALRRGEETGMFEISLDDVYYFYTHTLDDALHAVVTLINPLLLLWASVPLFMYVLR